MMKAVITGGSKGIGREMALAFAKEGAAVAVCARGDAELEELNRGLSRLNPDDAHICFPADLSRKDELFRFLEKVRESYGEIDVLVNNVGMYREAGLLNEPEGLLEETLNLNLLVAYHCSRFFSPGMKARMEGHIFNICSVASLQAVAVAGAYTVSKHALLGLSRSLREELRPFGVKVTSIIPGSTLTASWGDNPGNTEHLMDPADVAAAAINAFRLGGNANVDELLITPLAR